MLGRKAALPGVLCFAVLLCGAAAAEPEDAQEPKYLNESTAKPDWKPLDIVLPPPMFVGTPMDIWTPNLEKVTGKKRKPFLAPEGIKNLALGKAVGCSQMQPLVGDLEQVTDGDKSGADDSYIELKSGVQWVQIDLGKTCAVYAVVLWHFHLDARVYFDVVVRTAEDQDFIIGVETLFNNDHDNSSGLGVGKDKEYIETNEGKLVDAGGAKARYVRFYSNGNTANDLNHYIEVEVYGKPAE